MASSDDSQHGEEGVNEPATASGADRTSVDADSPSETATDPPDSDLELLRELDAFLEDIDRDAPTVRARSTPEDHYEQMGRLGRDSRTQAQVGIDHVRDDGIAVDGDSYIGLLKITPRNWLSLDSADREQVMSAYMSFLMSLRSPVIITCYPHEFDLSEHLQQFAAVGQSPDSQDDSPILQYGRKYYIDWASRRVDEQNIKRRAFYIVTRVEATHVHESLDSGSVLSRLPVIGTGLDSLRAAIPGLGASNEQAREELCIREVRTRQKRLAGNLGRTGIGLEIVRDRQTTMEVLYHYYNHVEPLVDGFDHATYSKADAAPTPTTEDADGGEA
jgi:hypothetical protein